MSQGGGFSQYPASQAASQAAGQGRVEYLTPITVALMKKAEDREGEMCLFGKRLGQVLLVGLVMEVKEGESKNVYMLSDCTGDVMASQWTTSKDDENPGPAVKPHPKGSYVKILGKISMWNDKPQLNVHQMRGLDSYNEVTQHYLMCNVVALEALKAEKGSGGMGMGMGSSVSAPKPSGVTSGGGNDFGASGGGDDDVQISDPAAREVYKLIEQHQGNHTDGANATEISKILGRDITKEMEFLTDEGQIYDTVDANWVRTTNS